MKKWILILGMLSMALLTACTTLKKNALKKEEPSILYGSDQYNKIPFSLDGGDTWVTENDQLKEFDVWNIDINDEVPFMTFFYATSHEELKKEIEKNKDNIATGYSYILEDNWNALLNHFDYEYFKENILLFYYKYEPNISKNYIYNVTIKDETLILNVNRFNGMDTAISFWIETISLKKEDIKQVNSFNIVLRTVAPLKKTITLSIKPDFIRDVYINGLDKEDFKGLQNLKKVDLWTSGMMLDIHFKTTLTPEKLDKIIDSLNASKNIKKIGSTSQTKVRVVIIDKLYDAYMQNNLTIKDILGEEVLGSEQFSLEYLKYGGLAFVTLELEQPGKENATKMLQQLHTLNFPFLYLEDLNGTI